MLCNRSGGTQGGAVVGNSELSASKPVNISRIVAWLYSCPQDLLRMVRAPSVAIEFDSQDLLLTCNGG